VEHALTTHAAPDANTNANTFSCKWDKLVQQYYEILKAKLQNDLVEDIVMKACPFIKSGTCTPLPVAIPDDLEYDMMEDLDICMGNVEASICWQG
jgi:hypothetical protein